MNPAVETQSPGSEPPRVEFHYLKAAAFKTVHIDGAIGSRSPSGHIHCCVFSERPAIPRQVDYQVNDEGELIGDARVIEGRRGYVRELEADLVLSVDVARALAAWLASIVDNEEEQNVMVTG